MQNQKILLNVKNLYKFFIKNESIFKAINNASFHVNESDFFGIIGESGSGKSTIGKTIIRLLTPESGNIIFDDKVISDKSNSKQINKFLAKNMQMVFQDPMASLNPKKNVLNLIAEPLVVNKSLKRITKEQAKRYKNISIDAKGFILKKQFEYSEQFYLSFYKETIAQYKQTIEKVNHWRFDDSINFSENKFSFFSLLDDLDQMVKKNFTIAFDYIKKYQGIIDEYDEYLKTNDIMIAMTKCLTLENTIKEMLNNIQYTDTYLSIINEIKELEENKKVLMESKYFLSEEETKKFIIAFIKTLKKDFSLLRKELSTTTNYLDALNIQIKMLQKALNIEGIFNFDKLNELDKQDILSAYERINEVTFNWIKEKFEIVDKLRVNDDQKEIGSLNTWIKSFNPKEEITKLDLMSVYDVSSYNSYEKVLITKTEIASIDKSIEELKQTKLDLENNKTNLLDEKIVNEKKTSLNSLKVKLEHNLNKINSLKKNENILLSKEYRKKHEELLKEVRHYKTKLNSLVKELDKLVTLKKQEFIKRYKHEKCTLETYDLKTFKTDLKIKRKSPKVVFFEFKNNVEILKLYESLLDFKKWKVDLRYLDLKDNIKLNMVYKSLNEVGLKNEHAYRYPHEFSGGQRQRIVIARALINNPKLIIADEAISALDVSVQAQVINIMKRLAKEKNITFIFIAHDLSMVNYACNRIIIMHNGRILEKGDTEEIFKNPIHPYTISLMNAAPELSKIHINLAQYSDRRSNYNPKAVNDYLSSFYPVEGDKEHFVFGKKEEVIGWCQKTLH